MTAHRRDSSSGESVLASKRIYTRMRWIACLFIALPFVLSLPLRYWALKHAGSWFVSTDLEPGQRQAFLGMMHFGLMVAISVWCFFGAAILLWRDRFYPTITGCTAIVLGIMAIPAGIFLAIGIQSYLKYS